MGYRNQGLSTVFVEGAEFFWTHTLGAGHSNKILKEYHIFFNIIIWLFWNPVVSWIGLFGGPVSARGSPVDDHSLD